MVSANTVAQNPGGSVIPPLSSAQAAAEAGAVSCASGAADGEPVASSMPMMEKVIGTTHAVRIRLVG
jgi:hypothetical protein